MKFALGTPDIQASPYLSSWNDTILTLLKLLKQFNKHSVSSSLPMACNFIPSVDEFQSAFHNPNLKKTH